MDKENILIELLTEEVNNLKKQRAEIETDLSNVQGALQYLKEKGGRNKIIAASPSIISDSTVQLYTVSDKTPTDSLKDTVLKIVLEKIEKFTTSLEITRLALELMPRYKEEIKTVEKFETFKTQVSSLLSLWKREDKIVKYQYSKSIKDSVWGRKEWLRENGEPKEGYFIDPLVQEAKLLQELELNV